MVRYDVLKGGGYFAKFHRFPQPLALTRRPAPEEITMPM
jgi:hypothetical protein